MSWQLQEAKNRFSEVVQRALRVGPQEVTVRGKPTVVVLAVEEYERLRGSKAGFVDALLAGPDWEDELVELINDRPGWKPREIDF